MPLHEVTSTAQHIEIGFNQSTVPPAHTMLVDLAVSANPLQHVEIDATGDDEHMVMAEVAHDNAQFLGELRALRERNVVLTIGDVAVRSEPDLDSGGVGTVWSADVTPVSDTEWEARRIDAARKKAMPWLSGRAQKRRRRF